MGKEEDEAHSIFEPPYRNVHQGSQSGMQPARLAYGAPDFVDDTEFPAPGHGDRHRNRNDIHGTYLLRHGEWKQA